MFELTRTVRFCLSDGSPAGGSIPPQQTSCANSFAAWPAMRGLGRYYELDVHCAGQADPQTGYFINIKQIDAAVRQDVLDYFEGLIAHPATHPADTPMGQIMQDILNLLQPPLHDCVKQIALHLTPTYHLTLTSDAMDTVTISQQFDFAAAHRLHVPELSAEENRAIFGKCNNPAGHGHNYRVEVSVDLPIDPSGHVAAIAELDELVNRCVIEPLDHKHLNRDVPAFANRNPSVEHIAQVIWEMLVDQVDGLGAVDGSRLAQIRVWETEKTCCTYRGGQA